MRHPSLSSPSLSKLFLFFLLSIVLLFNSTSGVRLDCNHASKGMQAALNTSFEKSVSRYDLTPAPWTDIKIDVMDYTSSYDCDEDDTVEYYDAQNGGGSGQGNMAKKFTAIVAEGEIACRNAHVLTVDDIDDKFKDAVKDARDKVENFLEVQYQTLGSALSFSKTKHACGMDETLTFDEKEDNTAFIVTATPFPNNTLWNDVPLWALPCAWDDAGRPLMVRFNWNPVKAQELSDSQRKDLALHHALHALGFSFRASQFYEAEVAGLERIVRYVPLDSIMESKYDCSSLSGFPLDDEFLLANQSELQADAASHWETRVQMNDIMSAGMPDDEITDLTEAWFSSLSSSYRVQNGFRGKDPAKDFKDVGCDIFENKCDSVLGKRNDDKFWCFPIVNDSRVLKGYACKPDFKKFHECGVQSWDFPLSSSLYRYFSEDDDAGGLSVYRDFCPIVKTKDIGRCESTSDTSSLIQGRGETYGKDSRCFGVDNAKQSSFFVPDDSSVRCLHVQCPFGTRIQFKLYSETTWRDCPKDGSVGWVSLSGNYEGKIFCPAAVDMCEKSLIPPVSEPTWKRIDGFSLEYGVTVAAKRNDGKKLCEGFGNSAVLAFLPEDTFLEAVINETKLVYTSTQTKVWVGAESSAKWESTLTYPLPSFSTLTTATGCWVVDLAAKTFSSENCDDQHPVACVRPLKGYAPATCGVGKFCESINPLDATESLQFWIPKDEILTSRQTAAGYCEEASGVLLNFSSFTSTEEITSIFQNVSDIFTGSSIIALRIGEIFLSSAPDPFWKGLVLNWPPSLSEDLCFVLVPISAGASTLRLKYVSCQVNFPAICVRENLAWNGTLPGYNVELSVYRLPTSQADAEAICSTQAVTLGKPSGTISPLMSLDFAKYILSKVQDVKLVAHMDASEGTNTFRVGATRTQTTVVFNSIPKYTIPSAGTINFLPSPSTISSQGDIEVNLDITGASLTFSATTATAALPFACANFYEYKNETKTGKTFCNNGTWCWNKMLDNELLYVSLSPASHANGVEGCKILGGWSIYTPPLPTPSLDAAIETLFSRDQILAAWAGMTYSASLQKFMSNGSVVASLDPSNPSLVVGSLSDNDCMAMYYDAAGEMKLAANPCDLPLPYLCRKSLGSADWTAYKGPSTNSGMHTLEFTALTTQQYTHLEGRQQCQAMGGDFAYFEFNYSSSSFKIDHLVNDLALTYAQELWFGLATDVSTGQFNYSFFLNASSGIPAAPTCNVLYANGSTAQKACEENSELLCARFTGYPTGSAPTRYFPGSGQPGQIFVKLPSQIANSSGELVVKATTNLSSSIVNIQSATIPANAVAGNVLFSTLCSSISEPTYSKFALDIEQDSVGVRTDAAQMVNNTGGVTVIWPCVNISASPKTGIFKEVVESFQFSVNASLLFPQSNLTLALNLSSTLQSNVSQLIFTHSEDGKLMTQGVNITATTAGQSEVKGTVVACYPSDYCRLGEEIDLITVNVAMRTILDVSLVAPPYFLGASNKANGTIKLLQDPSPSNISVKLKAGTVFIYPSEFSLLATTPMSFVFSSGTNGTFVLQAELTVTNRDDLPGGDSQILDETITYGDLVIRPIFPLNLGIELPTRSDRLIYPGEGYNITVHTIYDAVQDGANISVYLPSASSNYFTNGTAQYNKLVTKGNVTTLETQVSYTEKTLELDSNNCCQFKILVLAESNMTKILHNLSSSVDEIYLTIVPERSGEYLKMFPLPLALPSYTFVIRKKFRIVLSPVKVMAGGTQHNPIQISLPSAPVEKDVHVYFQCNDTMSISVISPLPILFLAKDFSTASLLRNITVRSPSTTQFNGMYEIPVYCWFSITAGLDIKTEMNNISFVIWPKSKAYLSSSYPTKVVPGTSFNVIISVEFDARSPMVTLSSMTNTSNEVTATLSTQQFLTGRILHHYKVSVGIGAESSQTCVSFKVSNPEMYTTPETGCFFILPLVTVSPIPNPRFKFAQPVGLKNLQTVSFRLSSPPQVGKVTAEIFCNPKNASYGKVTPVSLEWPIHSIPTASYELTQSVTLEGLEPFKNCDLSFTASGSTELVPITTPRSVFGKPIVFVRLLTISVSSNIIENLVFVGDPNLPTFSISLPQAPSAPVNVTFKYLGNKDSVIFNPTYVVFQNSSAEMLTKYVTLQGRYSSSTAAIQPQVSTLAGEFDESVTNGNVAFSIRNLYYIETMINDIPVTKFSMYCGGLLTEETVYFRIESLPVRPSDKVMISLNISATAKYKNQTILSTSPSSVVFSRANGQSTSLPMRFICAEQVKQEMVTELPFIVAAPSEYNKLASTVATLKPLETFEVSGFPTTITVGQRFLQAFRVRPTRMAPFGTILELELVTTCGSSVSIMDNGFGQVKMTWVDDVREITVPLVGLSPTIECQASLVLSPNTTAKNFEYYAHTGSVKVLNQPTIISFSDSGMLLSQDEFNLRKRWIFAVTDTSFIPAENVKVGLATPTGIIGATAASSTGSTGSGTTKPCILLSSTLSVNDDGLLNLWHRNPAILSISKNSLGRIEITFGESSFIITMKETVMMEFTEMCLTRQIAPPVVGKNNFTFDVEKQEDNIMAAQKAVVITAVSTAALASLAAGPAMATQGAKVSVLLDAGLCPLQDWKLARQEDLSSIENPFNIKLGSLENMGVYFGAAVMNCVFIFGWFFTHLVLTFLLYAYRNDQAVAMKSFDHSMATMRLPAVESFPVIYLAPIVSEQALRVVVYSPNAVMRAASAVICCIAFFGVLIWLIKIIRKPGARYDEPDDEVSRGCLRFLTRPRGKWHFDPDVTRDSGYLGKYSMFFDDYIFKYKYFLLVDIGSAFTLSLINAYEPPDKKRCLAKFGAVCFVFFLFALATIITRPYRRHSLNIFFILVAMAQFISSGISLASIAGRNGEWGPQAANICMLIVANLLIMKSLVDIFAIFAKLIYGCTIKGKVGKMRRGFMVDDSDMGLYDVFPWMKHHDQDIDEEDEKDLPLLTMRDREIMEAKTKKRQVEEQRVAEETRNAEILDLI